MTVVDVSGDVESGEGSFQDENVDNSYDLHDDGDSSDDVTVVDVSGDVESGDGSSQMRDVKNSHDVNYDDNSVVDFGDDVESGDGSSQVMDIENSHDVSDDDVGGVDSKSSDNISADFEYDNIQSGEDSIHEGDDVKSENNSNNHKKSMKDRIKSFVHPKHDESESNDSIKTSLGSLKFTKDLGENSDLEEAIEDEVVSDEIIENLEKNNSSDSKENNNKKSNKKSSKVNFNKEIDDDLNFSSNNDVSIDDNLNSTKTVDDLHSDKDVNSDDDLNSDSIDDDFNDDVDEVENVIDDEIEFHDSEDDINEVQNTKDSSKYKKSSNRRNFKSFFSDVVTGESKLEPKEIKVVKGEVIEEDDLPFTKPTPKDDHVVDAEIIEHNLEKPTQKPDSIGDSDELNIFTDDLPDFDFEKSSSDTLDIVGDAKRHYIDEVFENNDLLNEIKNNDVEDNKANIQDNESSSINDENVVGQYTSNDDINENDEYQSGDGVTYYQGSNDINSKLRKNNLYYDENKPKSVRDSIKGIKNDMKYINKSLKEIENPTQIDYVSVVDRTEEYDPRDYLNIESDDDSDKIIEREKKLTFAEKEELRIEEEMKMETLKKEIENDDDVIIPVHEQKRREELIDDELENIIQSADEDYKQIEKERYNQNNKLKSFDNHKLPIKKNIEDEIIDYVKTTDIGIKSQDELYNQPIDNVAQSIKMIVDVESPIHINELNNRFKENCNIKRAGVKMKKVVFLGVEKAEQLGDIIKIGDFLYNSANDEFSVRKRIKPNIDWISDEEISKSIEIVLTHNSNISTKKLVREASRNFGFKSTSKKTASRINSVLDLMIANNVVKIDDDFVELI